MRPTSCGPIPLGCDEQTEQSGEKQGKKQAIGVAPRTFCCFLRLPNFGLEKKETRARPNTASSSLTQHHLTNPRINSNHVGSNTHPYQHRNSILLARPLPLDLYTRIQHSPTTNHECFLLRSLFGAVHSSFPYQLQSSCDCAIDVGGWFVDER